jgi:hypothetical protein
MFTSLISFSESTRRQRESSESNEFLKSVCTLDMYNNIVEGIKAQAEKSEVPARIVKWKLQNVFTRMCPHSLDKGMRPSEHDRFYPKGAVFVHIDNIVKTESTGISSGKCFPLR